MAAPYTVTRRPRPEIAIVGGTGYLGRALTRALAARGRSVRVVSRGVSNPFSDLAGRADTVQSCMSDAESLVEVFRNIKVVVNFAHVPAPTWEAALATDVALSERLALAAARAGVLRFIHTGTIASYDMSSPDAVITEETPFGPLEGRSVYARSKAAGEDAVKAVSARRGLPLIVARPGIVIGGDGPLQHWGLGCWQSAGAVRCWNAGRNVLPFVLVDDVADAYVRMIDVEAAAGRSFNIVGEPLLSARDYLHEMARRRGADVSVAPGSAELLWVTDGVKAALKHCLRDQRGAVWTSLADWRSRGHLARFDNSLPKAVLGWRPEADRDAFLHRAIDEAALSELRDRRR